MAPVGLLSSLRGVSGVVTGGGAASSGLSHRVVASSRQTQQQGQNVHRADLVAGPSARARKPSTSVGRSAGPTAVLEACDPAADLVLQPLDLSLQGLGHFPTEHQGHNHTFSQVSSQASSQHIEGLPTCLSALLDPSSPVQLPVPGTLDPAELDNSRLDRLVALLGRGKFTWQRALQLYTWLKASAHTMDDRLCTTLIRVCADHGDALSALGVYEWMAAPTSAGGAGLRPTAYTYTAVMRAAAGCGMLDRAMQVWGDSQSAGLQPDCRLCITYIEVCMRLKMTEKAMQMYVSMRDSGPGSAMRPTAHAYTAAMRAATEGGRWLRALSIWEDMRRAGCAPTGHAYAAAISACSAGQDWARAVALFDDMTSRAGIRPDVVSCTALVTALASAGEADKAEALVGWMARTGLKPNVRTYTALLTAMGNARQWGRAVRLLAAMQQPEGGAVAPNAYTYSALLKAAGECGQWRLAEALFNNVESKVLAPGDAGRHLTSLARLTAAATAAEQSQVAYVAISQAQAALQHAQATAALGQGLAAGLGQQQQAEALMGALPQASRAGGVFGLGSGLSSQDAGQPFTELDIQRLGQQSSQGSLASLGGSMGGSQGGPQGGARNWSHPSQLNGLQLDLGLTSSPSPSPSPALNPSLSHSHFSSGGMQPPQSPMQSQVWQPQWLGGMGLGTPGSWQAGEALTQPGSTPGSAQDAAFSLFSAQVVRSRASLDRERTAALEQGGQAIVGQQASWSDLGVAAPSPQQQQGQGQQQERSQGGEEEGRGDRDLAASLTHAASASGAAHAPLVNDVVCGALMLAYERAGKWSDAIGMLSRARSMGVEPDMYMYNIAISAAGRAGQLSIAEQLFQAAPSPTLVSHESLMAAYGIAARPDKAEALLCLMVKRGYPLREYVWTAICAAYSLQGNVAKALDVGRRMRQNGLAPTVHGYNAMLAAAQRAQMWEVALELLNSMKAEGVAGNELTSQLMGVVGKEGANSTEAQQLQAAAVSAVVGAAGALLMRAGLF